MLRGGGTAGNMGGPAVGRAERRLHARQIGHPSKVVVAGRIAHLVVRIETRRDDYRTHDPTRLGPAHTWPCARTVALRRRLAPATLPFLLKIFRSFCCAACPQLCCLLVRVVNESPRTRAEDPDRGGDAAGCTGRRYNVRRFIRLHLRVRHYHCGVFRGCQGGGSQGNEDCLCLRVFRRKLPGVRKQQWLSLRVQLG